MATMSGKTPKEEEEDQWISGEELLTEGSSDEDACEPRAARKKQKTDVLLKRLLVSSLALPALDKTNKVVRPSRKLPKEDKNPSESTATDFQPKSLQESLRRSLNIDPSKPPHYEKGEAKSTNHLILEMNEFYFEMLDRLRFLRGNWGEPSDKNEGASWSFETSDQRFLFVLSEIQRDEDKYQQNIQMLIKEKKERKEILQEICSERKTPDERAEAEPQENCDENRRKAAKTKGEKDFVAKNKELAKEHAVMSRYCLTDEEKIKLETLLSDLDDADEDCRCDAQGGFKLDVDEEKLLEELESKLEVLSGEVSSALVEENQGRPWKFDLMQSRLKAIDKDLCALQDEKSKEGVIDEPEDKKYEAEYRKCLADLDIDFNGEECDGDGENYEDCLSQISLKIEDAMEEFE